MCIRVHEHEFTFSSRKDTTARVSPFLSFYHLDGALESTRHTRVFFLRQQQRVRNMHLTFYMFLSCTSLRVHLRFTALSAVIHQRQWSSSLVQMR